MQSSLSQASTLVTAFRHPGSSCGCGLPREIMERILDEVSGFADGQPQRDGLTLAVITMSR